MNKSILQTLCVRITNHCNLQCPFCRAGSSPYKREYINIELLKGFISKAKINLDLKHISISGGEPGVDSRLISFIDWLIINDFYVTVTTNGTVKLSKRLKGYTNKYSNKLRIRISIDGDKEIHDQLRGIGTYESAITELKSFKNCFGWIGVNTIVGPKLWNREIDHYDIFGNVPVDEWALITPVPKGSAKGSPWYAKEILPHLLNLRKKTNSSKFRGRVVIWNFLGTPNTSVLIQTNGSIILTGINGEDDINIGSLSHYSIQNIINNINQVVLNKKTTHFSWNSWNPK